ncbi:uncharacterized protein EHS24_000573 [Apiotrichum porosum]|uniref:Uncharacterized protein n=1 Tax=Apiotrichum porosum TaxID=105984 RepID=A0A427YAD8_9TREE|nr:uncharacterized protein EHS24_000573 [Apiotrichum porosum]RSH88048.1 hypothetical protein EHS24_000573 [Apiotrichum porosum]
MREGGTQERKRLAQSRKDYKNSLEARILAGEKFGYFYPNGDKVPPPVWPWEEKVLSPENPWFGLIFDFLVEQAPLAPQNRIADWGDESGFVVFNKDGSFKSPSQNVCRSFIEQLSEMGFEQKTGESGDNYAYAFHHPSFIKNDRDALDDIKPLDSRDKDIVLSSTNDALDASVTKNPLERSIQWGTNSGVLQIDKAHFETEVLLASKNLTWRNFTANMARFGFKQVGDGTRGPDGQAHLWCLSHSAFFNGCVFDEA